METKIIICLCVAIAALNIAILIVAKSKKSNGASISDSDKKELKDSFSFNVGVISAALERSNLSSKENLELRLDEMRRKIDESAIATTNKLESMERSQSEKLEAIRLTLERNVRIMQEGNERKLSEIKQTVDQKLNDTLNQRFKESFKYLSEELNKVSKTVGEMQVISKDVGNLTKVLSNVKTTGIFGEIQLGAIIDQILSPQQYVKNVVTNKQGKDPVEFAIKMPGGSNGEVLLPIDSKFPYTLYNDMTAAYNSGDFVQYELKQKELIQRIKQMAKDIKEKYVCPPYTTNFAVMFLPIEGLYAEVVKLGLVEQLQSRYSVTVAGPTTMAALLNSLQMGFQTLSLQKKTSEVWEVLGSVKTEFDRFNEILTQIQNRLNAANVDLDKLIGVRSRAITRSLKEVTDSLPSSHNRKSSGSEIFEENI